jgi:hypothetical protein
MGQVDWEVGQNHSDITVGVRRDNSPASLHEIDRSFLANVTMATDSRLTRQSA